MEAAREGGRPGRPPFIYVPLAKEKMLGLESKDRLALAA